MRAGRVVSHGLQGAAQQIAFVLVLRHVHRRIRDGADHPLPDRRSVDVPQDAIGHGARAAQFGGARQVRRNRQIADALAGDRHRLRPAPGDHRAVEDAHRFGRDRTIERERPVRLIADDQHRVRQDMVHCAEHGVTVNHSRWVIGGIQDQGAGARRECGGNARRVGLEVIAGFHRDNAPAVIFDIEAILGEVGGQDHDLVAGVEDGFEDDIDGCGGPIRHQNFVRREGTPDRSASRRRQVARTSG